MVKWWEMLLFGSGVCLGWIIGFIHGWNRSVNDIGLYMEVKNRKNGS